MGCRERQRQLQDYLSDDLAPSSRTDLEAHLETCRGCRDDLAAYRLLMRALPTMPDPPVPADLGRRVLEAVRPYQVPNRPQRESVRTILVRRAAWCTLGFAFAVAFGVALWDWGIHIVRVTGQSISVDLLALWGAARDIWAILQLLGEVADALQPTALNLLEIARRIGSPLAGYGLLLLILYGGTLLLGTLLCLRAWAPRGARRFGHAS